MRKFNGFISLTSVFLISAVSALAMDAERGAQVIRDQNCLRCHTVRGDGGSDSNAPDLSEQILDSYTGASLAAALWNHLPEMWRAMSRDLVGRPQPSERDAEDIFAYLYSLRFFDRPGDATRGRSAFTNRNCATCHSLTPPANGPGTPVSNWPDVSDAFGLVQEMWNHSSRMQRAAEAQGIAGKTPTGEPANPFRRLTARDLSDITAFVQQSAGRTLTGRIATRLSFPTRVSSPAPDGKALFTANCGGCHPRIIPLEGRLRNETLTSIAAGIWNHASRMQPIPLVASGDMQAIVGYLWQMQYSQPTGNVGRGQRAFTAKRCAVCHNDAEGASRIARGERVFTPFTLISLWWKHGPLMEKDMTDNKVRWPELSERDVADIVAYMNTRP